MHRAHSRNGTRGSLGSRVAERAGGLQAAVHHAGVHEGPVHHALPRQRLGAQLHGSISGIAWWRSRVDVLAPPKRPGDEFFGRLVQRTQGLFDLLSHPLSTLIKASSRTKVFHRVLAVELTNGDGEPPR